MREWSDLQLSTSGFRSRIAKRKCNLDFLRKRATFWAN